MSKILNVRLCIGMGNVRKKNIGYITRFIINDLIKISINRLFIKIAPNSKL